METFYLGQAFGVFWLLTSQGVGIQIRIHNVILDSVSYVRLD